MSVPSARPATPRRTVSAQRYLVRRIGAAVVLVATVAGAVLGVRAVFGGDGAAGESREAESGTSVAGASDPAPSTAGAAATDAPPVDDTTPGTATPGSETMTIPSTDVTDEGSSDEPPTAASPARIYIAGDSDAGTFGPYLQELLADVPEVETQLDYKTSSGLSRPDFFDWPARFGETIPAYDPDIVVITFGGNDAQGLTDQASGEFITGGPVDDEADWEAEYGRRVGEMMDLLSSEGRTLIWVGIPNHRTPDVTERMAVQDGVVRAMAEERPGVVYIDTWERFSGRNGGFAQYVVDPRDGEGKSVRAGDGFHLNEIGAEILALDIAEAVRAALRTRGLEL